MRRESDRGRRLTPSAPAIWCAAAALAVAAPAPAAPAADAKVVRSMSQIRYAGVIRQEWDLSCGAAAIATLMTYQLGHPVTERQVALAILKHTSPALVRARFGFSLLDLKIYAATQGFAAAGYGDLTLGDLDAMAPAIVPIRWRGFPHFIIYRGRSGDRVLVADPAFGNRTLPDATFKAIWANHVGFVVFDPAHPHAPNRMGAPAELFLAVRGQAVRAAIAGGAPSIFANPVGSKP